MSLDIALSLWRRGLSVIPVPRPRPGVAPGRPGDGKVPVIAWKEYQKRLPTEDELRSWFSEPMNLAVVTGAVSGVVVIDADSPAATRWIAEHLPRTPWQTRTSRGFHLWYRHPDDVRVGNRARLLTPEGRLAIDVRGDGGYVIAPGSVHASGCAYEFAGDWTVPRDHVPFFWPGWIERPVVHRRETRPRPTRPTGDVVERARRYLAAIPRPEIGQGSDNATLYAACKLTRGFGLTEADTVSLLWDWAGSRDGWTLEWVERKVRNAIRYGTEPVGTLR